MKTFHLIVISFLAFFSQAGFADSLDQSNNCCQTTQESAAIQYQNQQVQLDQIQRESEDMILHSSGTHVVLQKQVSEKVEEHTAMNRMQSETESIPVISLQLLSEKVAGQVSSNMNVANK